MTTTHDTPQAHETHGSNPAQPAPLDPEHDIDARSTAIWVLASAVVLFIGLYFMLPLFDRVLMTERNKKINERPALELQEVMAKERAFLEGEQSPSNKSIEQVMEDMVK